MKYIITILILCCFYFQSFSQIDLSDYWIIKSDSFENEIITDWSFIPESEVSLQPYLSENVSYDGSTALTVDISKSASYLYKSGLRPSETGFLSFWFNPGNVIIPDTSGWFTGNTFRIASILGGSSWHSLASIRIRQSENGYKGFIEYRDSTSTTKYDYSSGEFNILSGWQKLTIGYIADSSIIIWRNDTIVRELTGINHSAKTGSIIEIGKTTSNSGIVPSGSIMFDDVTLYVPSFIDIYVDASVGNDSNSGDSPSTPFRTIQKGADKAGPGSIVHIAPGIYNEKVSVKTQGEAGKPIRFLAEGIDSVIIDGTGIVTDGNGSFFQMSNISNIEVNGIHVRNTDCSGLYAYRSNNIKILDCSTRNTYSSGIKVRECNGLTIDGNDIRLACNGGGEECITVSSSYDFEVSRNTVHEGAGLNLGGEGICIKGNGGNGSVHHNTVVDLPRDYNPNIHEDGEVGIYIGAYSTTNYLHNVDVYSNISTTPVGIAVSSEEGGHTDSIRIFNNLVYDCYQTGIQITNWVVPNTGPKTNISIVNNTVYNCRHLTGSYPVGHGIYVESKHADDENYVVSNNIVSNCGEFQIRVCSEALPHTTVSNNLLFGYQGLYDEDITGSDSVIGDPMFINPDENDFRIHGSSPAINKGDNSKVCSNSDYRDADRFQEEISDIGAYEWTLGLDPSDLQSSFVINEITLEDNEIRCFDALNSISLPEADNNAEFQSGATATFIAGVTITLKPGFKAMAGSYIHAYITEEGNFCDQSEQNPVTAPPVFKSIAVENFQKKSGDIKEDINFRIYPNPTSGIINFDTDDQICNPLISIIDLTGKEVYKGEINSGLQSKIDVSYLKKGFYLVRLQFDRNVISQKIIKD